MFWALYTYNVRQKRTGPVIIKYLNMIVHVEPCAITQTTAISVATTVSMQQKASQGEKSYGHEI